MLYRPLRKTHTAIVRLPGKYSDIELGLYIVRGDNIVLLGEIDAEKEEKSDRLKRVSPEDIADLAEPQGFKLDWDFDV